MDDLLAKIAAIVPTLQGWCTVEKAQWLAQWIVEHRCVNVVEIGVFGGRSLIPMAMAMEHLDQPGRIWLGHVSGIDPYSNLVAEADEKDEANRNWWKTVDLASIRKGVEQAIVAHRLGSIVDLLFCTSEHAVANFADDMVDLVHVDGSHNEAASTWDVRLWWPKVRPGGIMVMDDTDWAQVKSARQLAASMGKLVHHNEKWEVFQKEAATDASVKA